MRNIEFKAELREPEVARAICKRIGASLVARIRQVDTYYAVASGRVKKRESELLGSSGSTKEPTEYIVYSRADRVDLRASDYSILTFDELQARYGTAPLPEWLRVSKTRELYLKDSVRVHIDQVDELGWYFELESLVSDPLSPSDAEKKAALFRDEFQSTLGEPVASSYSDLLELHRALRDKE